MGGRREKRGKGNEEKRVTALVLSLNSNKP